MSQIGLSRRAGSLKPSSTLAVAQRARQMKEAGEDVLAFAAGEPDFVTPEIIRKAAKDALDKGMTHYAPTLGTPGARAAVARKLGSENGIEGLTPKHVAIGVGGKQCLYNVFQALLNEGDEVLLDYGARPNDGRRAGPSGRRSVPAGDDRRSVVRIGRHAGRSAQGRRAKVGGFSPRRGFSERDGAASSVAPGSSGGGAGGVRRGVRLKVGSLPSTGTASACELRT